MVLKSDFVDADVAATVHAGHHNALATAANAVITVIPSGDTAGAADTVAVNNALTSGAEVRLKFGTYYFNAPVNMQNMSGTRLVGSGMSSQYGVATKLVWVGVTDGSSQLIDMSGTNYCSIERVGLYANQSAVGTISNVRGIQGLGNPTYHGSFFNSFDHIYFQNFNVAVNIGLSTDQVDTWTFDKCWFYYGATGTGVSINSSNSLAISLRNCTLTGSSTTPTTATGVYLAAGAGSFHTYQCITANNEYGIRIAGTPDANSSIIANHSEEDQYPIYTDVVGNGQHALSLTVSNFFCYGSKASLFYLGNANLLYNFQDVRSTAGGGNDNIQISSAGPIDMFQFWNVIFAGTLTFIGGGTATPPGLYGPQGVSVRTQRLLSSLLVGSVQILDDASGAFRVPGSGGIATPRIQDLAYGGPYVQMNAHGIAVIPRGVGNQFDVSQGDSIILKKTAGAPTDGAFTATPTDGTLAIDTTNSKIYVRIGGTWKGVTVA